MILLKKLHCQNEEKACEIALQKVIHENNESGLDSVRALLLRRILRLIRKYSQRDIRALR